MAKSCERSTPDEVVIHDEPREPVTDPTLGIPVEAPRSADPAHRLVTIGDSLTHGFMSGAVFRTDLSWPALVAYELGLPAEGFRFPTYEWPTGPGGLPVDLERLARAFERRYGPKLDFKVKDAIGREWQLGTLQVDMNLPERFDVSYVGEDGEKHRPIMLHRALFGSLERFTGIMIEHYAGKFPFWLAPVQAVVATITDDGDEYAKEVQKAMKKAGLRVELDLRNEKISYKVREHSMKKVPVIIAIGKREAAEHTVALRRLGEDKQEVLPLSEAIAKLTAEAAWPHIED